MNESQLYEFQPRMIDGVYYNPTGYANQKKKGAWPHEDGYFYEPEFGMKYELCDEPPNWWTATGLRHAHRRGQLFVDGEWFFYDDDGFEFKGQKRAEFKGQELD